MDKHLNIILLILAGYLIYLTRDVLFVFYVAFLLALAANPFVDRLENYRIPRSLSIIVVYLFFWSSFGLLIAVVTPPLVSQTRHLLSLLPESVQRVELFSQYQVEITREIFSRISLLPQAILNLTIGFFSNLLTIFTTLIITYYLLVQRKNIPDLIHLLPIPKLNRPVSEILTKIEQRLSHWLFGELTLMFAVGLLTYIGLKILGVEAALPLAIIAGILELIPNIGPTVSAIPAILVALTIHPFLALSTTALYFLVQFVENNFLVPKIMEKAAGVNPLLSIIGLMVGFRLAGPMGAILAIPTIIVVETIYFELSANNKNK